MPNATRPPRAAIPDGMKWCPRCRVAVPLSDFGKNASRSDGVSIYCRPCLRDKQREWRAKNAPCLLDYRRTFRARHLETEREREREAARREWAERPDEILARRRSWEERNREERRRYKRHVQAERRARLANAATVRFTLEQLEQRIAYFGHRCWVCRSEHEAVDHVKPLAKGGAHMLSNLRPICTSCNSSKGTEWPFTSD